MAAQHARQTVARCWRDEEYGGITRTIEFNCGCTGFHDQCADIFHGQITVRNRDPAANYAYYAPMDFWRYPKRVLVWTDASGAAKRTHYSGAAVVFQRAANEYTHFGFAADLQDSSQAELLAIFESMYLIFHHVERGKEVLIFTDSYTAIQWIASQSLPLGLSGGWKNTTLKKTFPQTASFRDRKTAGLVKQVIDCSQRLQERGIAVHLHWVPGHENIIGNERADALSKACRISTLELNLHTVARNELSIPLTREQILAAGTSIGRFHLHHWIFGTLASTCEASQPAKQIGQNECDRQRKKEPRDHKPDEERNHVELGGLGGNELQQPNFDQIIDQNEPYEQQDDEPEESWKDTYINLMVKVKYGHITLTFRDLIVNPDLVKTIWSFLQRHLTRQPTSSTLSTPQCDYDTIGVLGPENIGNKEMVVSC